MENAVIGGVSQVLLKHQNQSKPTPADWFRLPEERPISSITCEVGRVSGSVPSHGHWWEGGREEGMLTAAVKLCPPWCSQQGARASQNFSLAPGTGDREALRLVSSSQH